MLFALLSSVIAFAIGTYYTQERFLTQQTAKEADLIRQALAVRADNVTAAADLLAHDPNVVAAVQSGGPEALETLNERAMLVSTRLNLDVIQIYDQRARARVNLMNASLYREPLLLDAARSAIAIQVVRGRILLLRFSQMSDDVGAVVTGLDMATELHRLVTAHGLSSDVVMCFEGVCAGTRYDLPIHALNGRSHGFYNRRVTASIGDTTIELLLIRSLNEITQVTRAGLTVMIVSMLLTTVVLILSSVGVTRSISLPVQRLSAVAERVAQGDLCQQVVVDAGGPLRIGSDDEIGLLAATFNKMVAELRDLYSNLEDKVASRTRDLATLADVARAIASSLDLNTILKESAQALRAHLGFDYVGIFLIESESQLVVLQEAAGKIGGDFKTQEIQLPVGSQSPVGIAAATGQACIVQDFTGGPLQMNVLPCLDARAEAAIPLIFEKAVLGVLDIQSTCPNIFTPDIVNLLATSANQIAIGIHNTQLYVQQKHTAEQLAEIDQIKTQFLAVMSHELRTPLNSIIGFSKVLLKGLDGPLTETQKHDLQIVCDSGQHLLTLVQDLIDISRINAGKMELEIEEVDLQEMVQSVLDALSALVRDKPVTLAQSIAPDIPPVPADRRRLRQILLNLLSNAVKFTEAGMITVSAQTIRAWNPSSNRVEPFVQVDVTDTGIGIPPEKLNDIFVEFVQVDSSDSRCYGGAGLGLPIAKKLVELHGGRIWAKSQVGHGSSFIFTLPLLQNSVTRDTFATEDNQCAKQSI